MWKLVTIALILVVLIIGCTSNNQVAKQAKESTDSRADTLSRASALYPDPQPVNFPIRQALVEYTKRADRVNVPWYTYTMADNGNFIGYYVTKTPPINSCNFLSSTESVYVSSNGNLILQAPSLDAIYYGGSGASSGCDAWFFFDYATDALITIRGIKFFSTDQPLLVDIDPIEVRVVE